MFMFVTVSKANTTNIKVFVVIVVTATTTMTIVTLLQSHLSQLTKAWIRIYMKKKEVVNYSPSRHICVVSGVWLWKCACNGYWPYWHGTLLGRRSVTIVWACDRRTINTSSVAYSHYRRSIPNKKTKIEYEVEK